MLVSVGLVALFAVSCLTTNMVLIPEMDQGQVSVTIGMPIGSSLEESTAIADQVAAVVQEDVPELESFYYMAQSGGSGMMSSGIPPPWD